MGTDQWRTSVGHFPEELTYTVNSSMPNVRGHRPKKQPTVGRPYYTGWPEKNVPKFRMALCNTVDEMNQRKNMYVMSKHLRMSMNFHRKLFHISRDTSEIVLHVIKQCLQAFYHHRNRFSKLMVSAGVSWNGKKTEIFSLTLKRLKSTPSMCSQCVNEDLHWLFEDVLAARMPPSVSRQWFRLLARQRSITPRQSNSKFSLRQRPIILAHKNGHRIRQIWIR